MASTDIIRKNLGMKIGIDAGSMQNYLMKAGIEGATTIGKRRYDIAGVNFYYSLATGEIFLFSDRDARYHKAEGVGMGHFKIAVDKMNEYANSFFMILSVTYDMQLETPSLAKDIIESSMENYNVVACRKRAA